MSLARRLPRLPGLAWRQGSPASAVPGATRSGWWWPSASASCCWSPWRCLEANLGRQLAYEHKREAPTFFFIDVQTDQREAFARLVSEVSAGAEPVLTPIVRARLAAIDGAPVTRALIDRRKKETPDKVWYLTREYVLTWAAAPPRHGHRRRAVVET